MATSTKSAETEEDRKPTFTFEQLVLRLVVAVLLLALTVTAVELGQVRGRVHTLETGGAPRPRRPPRTRWARPSRSRCAQGDGGRSQGR